LNRSRPILITVAIMVDGLKVLSDCLGWLYTLAWSGSFYPQVILNHKRKSVTGLSFEYQAYNMTGYIFYFIYCYSDYIVQHDSKLGLTQSVEINDLVFVSHAVIIQSVVVWQCLTYKLKTHHLNRWHSYIIAVYWILLSYNLALCAAGILPFVNRTPDYRYSVVEYLGYVKVSISFIKYCPQAWMNFTRQSTFGWSIGNVLLDLSGGLLAFGQQAVDAYRLNDASVFTSNVAKLLLSMETIGFDCLFIVQHYILYRQNNALIAERNAMALSVEEQEAIERETQAKAEAAKQALLAKAKSKATGAISAGHNSRYTSSEIGGGHGSHGHGGEDGAGDGYGHGGESHHHVNNGYHSIADTPAFTTVTPPTSSSSSAPNVQVDSSPLSSDPFINTSTSNNGATRSSPGAVASSSPSPNSSSSSASSSTPLNGNNSNSNNSNNHAIDLDSLHRRASVEQRVKLLPSSSPADSEDM